MLEVLYSVPEHVFDVTTLFNRTKILFYSRESGFYGDINVC